tara:strand:+ start:290 stop:649 length:360 start_codon:yes stop_codon:yes gene_type:complete
MGRHRTPQDLLNDALAKVASLQLKVAQASVASDPRMKVLTNNEIESKKKLLTVQRWLKPEIGLASRIEKLTAQIAEAKENLENARANEIALLKEIRAIAISKEELATVLADEQGINLNG